MDKIIPKILYCIYLSPDPMPDKFKKYVDTWSVKMPDYEIRHINLDNVVKNNFTLSAIAQKKYALAGHYARHQLLYETGGIYLDADIEVVKSFDDLLDNQCFLGREDVGMVNNAVMASVAGHPFHRACMDELDKFDTTEIDAELKTGPWMVNMLYGQYDVKIYPEEYFYPFHYTKQFTDDCIKENTHTIHWWAKSWG